MNSSDRSLSIFCRNCCDDVPALLGFQCEAHLIKSSASGSLCLSQYIVRFG
jgi:hypothetical protein